MIVRVGSSPKLLIDYRSGLGAKTRSWGALPHPVTTRALRAVSLPYREGRSRAQQLWLVLRRERPARLDRRLQLIVVRGDAARLHDLRRLDLAVCRQAHLHD